jgi:putative peptidoglycan lipid II flippase
VTEESPAGPPAEASADGGGVSLASVGRSAVILTGATAAVQLIAIVRELYLAAQVGVSVELDALLIGIVLPTTLGNIVMSGPSTALVPAYLEARAAGGLGDARRLSGTVLVWLGVVGLALTLLMEIGADAIIAVTGPGLSAAGRASAAEYLRFLAPTAFVASLTGTFYAVCQAEQRFATIGIGMISGGAATFATMILFWQQLGLGAFALGSLVGPIIAVSILMVDTIRLSVAPRPHLVSRGLGLRAFVGHAAPLTLSSAILQINAVFDRAVASLIAPGAVSALRYGDTLVRVPTGAISPAWGAAIYPALVRATQGSDSSSLATATERSLRMVTVVFMPISALTLAVAPVAVAVAYGRGAFTSDALNQTAQVVAGFAPLIVTLMISQTLTGALNARRRGSVLLAAGTINVILNCALDIVLGIPLGVAGVALSSSVTAVVVATFKARRLARFEESLQLRPLARKLVLAVVAALPGALVCGALAWTGIYPAGLVGGLAALAVFGLAGVASYVILATRLGLGEPRMIVDVAWSRVARRRAASGSAR